jgi:hypothetical protein
MLSYNLRSAAIQPTAIVQAGTEIGFKYMFKGINGLFTGEGEKALKMSNVLNSRQHDETIARLMNTVTGKIGNVQKQISKFGMKPLQALDMQTAKATWLGAYKKATEEMRLVGREAINYADDVVIRTQGSGNVEHLSAAQRTAIGRSVTLFQSFVINNWGFITRDILGINNAKITNKDTFAKVTRYVAGATAMNFLYEDLAGTYSPFPTPLKATYRAMKAGDNMYVALAKGTAELAELTPVIGGAWKYGSGPGGPMIQLGNDITNIIRDKPGHKDVWSVAGTATGIPGVAQAKRVYKGIVNEENIINILLGKAGAPDKGEKGASGVKPVGKVGKIK